MAAKEKFILIVLLASMILMNIAFLPGTAYADDSSSEIFENISLDKKPSNFAEILDYFETVTVNPAAFLNDVSDGHVTLRLLGQEFQLDLQEIHIASDDAVIITENGSRIPAPKSYSYRGTVVGKPNSSVILTVGDDVLIGDINLENKSYFIEQTNITHNGKVVHVVYSSDALKKMEILEYCTDGPVEYTSNLSIFRENNTGELSNSDSKGSESGNERISNGDKSNKSDSAPCFGLFGSLICLYSGWKLRKK